MESLNPNESLMSHLYNPLYISSTPILDEDLKIPTFPNAPWIQPFLAGLLENQGHALPMCLTWLDPPMVVTPWAVDWIIPTRNNALSLWHTSETTSFKGIRYLLHTILHEKGGGALTSILAQNGRSNAEIQVCCYIASFQDMPDFRLGAHLGKMCSFQTHTQVRVKLDLEHPLPVHSLPSRSLT